MHQLDFDAYVASHNRRITSAMIAYALGAALAWIITAAAAYVLTFALLRIRYGEVNTAMQLIGFALVMGAIAGIALWRIGREAKLWRDARVYYHEGPDSRVTSLRMQEYLASRQLFDSTSWGMIVAQLVLAAAFTTAAVVRVWRQRVSTDRLRLADAENVFDDLGQRHAWIPLIDYTGRGQSLWMLQQLDLLWIRYVAGRPEIRIAADVAQNYFPPTSSNDPGPYAP
jgi:hypothetical protein